MRSPRLNDLIRSASDAELVCVSVMERVGPLFHLDENASSLHAAPLLSQDVHWHMARLRQQARSDAMREAGVDPGTLALLQSLTNGPTRWLNAVAMEDLVRLRGEGANRAFRDRMSAVMSRLSATAPERLDRVAGEVAHEFRSIVEEHEADLRRIEERSRANTGALIGATIASVAASFMPWFPVVGAASAVGALAALASQKAQAEVERAQARGTLVGVLAAAARRTT